MDKAQKQNKMGTMHEGKLLFSMSVPLMISMLVTALYNIVDTFFVSRIDGLGEAAATALSLAFPIQMFMISLTVGTGVGLGAALSKAIGSGNREMASKIAGNAMFLYGVYYIILLLFGIFAAGPFIALFTDDADVLDLGTTYLSYVTVLSFGNIGEKCFEKLLQSTGRTTYSMIGQLIGSALNVILDPIFIFGYFGVPAMGVKGAAIATVIGQCFAIALTAVFHFKADTEMNFKFSYLKPDKEIIGAIMKVGVPAIIMQGLTSFMTLGMNFILKGVSVAAVTAYGIYYKLQNFIFMPAFGINNACVPIIGYNFGAKNMNRIKNTIRYAVIQVLAIMILGILIFQIFAESIVGIFKLSDEFTRLCVTAIRIITCGFIFAGINVLLQGVCQTLGGGIQSLIISALRLIVIVLPVAAVLAQFNGAENIVWIAFPIAEVISFVIAIILTMRLYNRSKILKKL